MSFLNQKNKVNPTNVFQNLKTKEEPKKLIVTNNLINTENKKGINIYRDLPNNIQEKEEIPNYEENKNFKQLKTELNKGSNFIDYFVEIGVDPSIYKKGWLYDDNLSLEELNKKEELKPKIISYFPPMEKETISFFVPKDPKQTEEERFAQSTEVMVDLCFPNGYYLIKSNTIPNYEIFSFILDNSNVNLNYPQKFLSCIIFYESISQYKELYDQNLILNKKEKEIFNKETTENPEEIYIPKCLLIMSLYPFFNEFENILLKIYEYSLGKIKLYNEEEILEDEEEKKDTIEDGLDIKQKIKEKYVENEDKDVIIKCKKFGKNFVRKRSKSFNNVNDNNEDIINDKNNNDNNISKKKSLARKVTKSIKTYLKKAIKKKNNKNDYILNEFFPNLGDLKDILAQDEANVDNYTYHCLIPIDKFIENLLIELPFPPRGKTEIKYNLMNQERKLIQNKMNQLPLININLKNLFVKFSIEKIIDIYHYLFLETRVLFFSQNIDILNVFIYGLLSLLYPFEYQYQVITILPKANFAILESITPFIAGINQQYTDDFFEKFDLALTDFVLIVDLDNCELKYINCENSIPDFPKANKRTLDKMLNDILNKDNYKNIFEEKLKNKNFDIVVVEKENGEIKTENNSQINERKKSIHSTILSKSYKFNNFAIDFNFNYEINSTFFNFNASLLADYSKYLDLSFYSSNVSPCLEVLFKVKEFLNDVPTSEKEFYDKFITETQLFGDYLYKRMIPKNSKEKIRVLIFDETIHEYHKPIFPKTHQCVFIKSSEYNFEEKYEVQKPREITKEEKNFILNNQILLLSYGIIIEDGKKIKFRYPVFPKLLTHKFFLDNIQEYYTNTGLNENIDLITMDIISKSHLGGIAERQNDMRNYIDLCWLQMWAMTFWYCDKKEKKYRFQQLLRVINKTSSHEMEILNLLFDTLEKNGEEYMVLKLYDVLLKLKLNPSFKVHNIVMKYLDKYKSGENIHINDILQNIIKKEIYDVNEKVSLKKRTLKSKYYKNILFEEITFYAFDICIYCQNFINLFKKSTQFEEMNREIMWIKCDKCGQYSLVKFLVQFGKEINKDGNMKFNTSKYDSVVLFSPYSLKMNYKSLLNDYGINVDVEELMFKYNNLFWNSIWYFRLFNLDCDFMLPYYDKNSDIEELKSNIRVTTDKIFD